mgnify:CR=1 FL=1
MFSDDVKFANPEVLWLLLIIPFMVYWYWKKNKKITPDLKYSSISMLKGASKTLRERLAHIPYFLRLLAIALLIIAIARPQNFRSGENIYTEGIDIAMVLDISSSMLAEDFRPNRLEAAKQVIDEFIQGRVTDKIGLVIFSRESFTQCPLTTDHAVLVNLFKAVKYGMIEDGTAIGLGLANAVNRIKESKAKSKVIILLTDGSNNRGDIAPITAAEIARTFGIRVYAIGVGSYGQVNIPVQTPMGTQYQLMDSEFDEESLKEIAAMTGGNYFRATDNNKLRSIYQEIDQMEKTKINVKEYSKKNEDYYLFALAALLLLIAELILRNSVLRKIP